MNRSGSGRDALGFATSRLIRHSAEREHLPLPDREAPDSLHVLLVGGDVLLRAGRPETCLLGPAQRRAAAGPAIDVFLGTLDERPVFAASLPAEAAASFPEPDFRTSDLRWLAVEGSVEPHELGLLATAKSLLTWHARHGFCANCGTPTEIRAAGFRRECPNCGTHHFPRTDPVVIMLIRDGDRCLIGRGPHFPEGMYSCLAGFLEPGETIEDAVRRETAEETGIRIGAVRYHACQPWPFPSSLMIGCVAEAESRDLVIDPAELADARWVDRVELATLFARTHPEGIFAPQPMAIAHLLLRNFLDGRL
ncbi:NAD(+) diphosphatase [Methylobacterium organophilum]|uniref:NAD(+) diphosphatase n=1 Tax=Methylobacterium organophilum TaxID=410 RepID=A0ABQ4TBW7_METOR|nr:NAD(+) diphosphatase [Methylobacterium organophilum]GJE28541.1 NADH pyrophosphatase [Methylobacterium organophilum]